MLLLSTRGGRVELGEVGKSKNKGELPRLAWVEDLDRQIAMRWCSTNKQTRLVAHVFDCRRL